MQPKIATVTSKVEKAPRPSKASYARSLYDAIRAIGGPADLQTIIEIIPATDDAARWSKAKPLKVLELLVSNRGFGYFVETPDGKWIIAPREYYDKRQQHHIDVRSGAVPRDRPQHRKSVEEIIKVVHAEKIEIACALVSGILIGLAVAYFV
jgi:hypothetical protein